jgi:hypothetical protein
MRLTSHPNLAPRLRISKPTSIPSMYLHSTHSNFLF